MSEKLSSLLEEARERLALVRKNLPTTVEVAAVSTTAKMPFKALTCREGLIWRTEELGRTAYECFERGDIVAGILLTRGVTETVSALWYLKELIARQLANGLEPDLDEKLMQLLMGHRTETDMPAAINVQTFVDRASKSFPHLRESYDSMSEYAHPNWAGSGFAFSKIERTEFVVHYGRNLKASQEHICFGANCLVAALTTLEVAYNGISDLMPNFIEVCEADLRRGD
jgi:hypothetical protein